MYGSDKVYFNSYTFLFSNIVLVVVLFFIMQIMPGVFILGFIHALPAYRDLVRGKGPKHISIF